MHQRLRQLPPAPYLPTLGRRGEGNRNFIPISFSFLTSPSTPDPNKPFEVLQCLHPLGTREAPSSWRWEVTHLTWFTCRKSLRSGPSPARLPWGSDYLRRLSPGEVETLGDREGHPAAPETSRASSQVWAPQCLFFQRRPRRSWASGRDAFLPRRPPRLCRAPRLEDFWGQCLFTLVAARPLRQISGKVGHEEKSRRS